MALIPYNEASVNLLSSLHLPERCFKFGDINICISQDWTGRGLSAVVWDAAVILAHYLFANRNRYANSRVLELGAGTGLCGILLGLIGCSVTLTDRGDALSLLRRNVEGNLRKANATSTLHLHSRSQCPRVEVQELDWAKPPSDIRDRYNLVIGSDLVYEGADVELLRNTLLATIGPKTEMLLATRIRYRKDEEFLERLGKDFTMDVVFSCAVNGVKIHRLVSPSGSKS